MRAAIQNELFAVTTTPTPVKEIIETTLKLYGWTCIETKGEFHFFNKNKVGSAILKFKGDRYKFVDYQERLLLSGTGQLAKSIHTLLTQYFYCATQPAADLKEGAILTHVMTGNPILVLEVSPKKFVLNMTGTNGAEPIYTLSREELNQRIRSGNIKINE